MPEISSVAPVNLASASKRHQQLWDVAKELETTFISEMLKSAGLGEARDSFGGGIGEEQFSSFLRNSQAKAMVDSGGIGLAQSIFESLKERDNAAL